MGRFKKGEPRHPNAGRRPGSKNKKTLLKVEELLANQNIHPVQLLIDLLPKLDPPDAARTLIELLKFIQPQLKHQETIIDPPKPPLIDAKEDTSTLLSIVDAKQG